MSLTHGYARHCSRGRFWHFVQNFWQCHGGTGYDDEWHVSPGRFYADLSSKSVFKTCFPYHLELTKINSKQYSVSVQLRFNHEQCFYVCTSSKVNSKKEAIRKTLQLIKQFEKSEKCKEVWKDLLHDIPIVNSDGVWVATNIIGCPSETLITRTFMHTECKLGYGIFYCLEKRVKEWRWKKYDLSYGGYCSSSCNEVPFEIWQAILGYNPIIDQIIKKSEEFNCLTFENDFNIEKAEYHMQCFYESQMCGFLEQKDLVEFV